MIKKIVVYCCLLFVLMCSPKKNENTQVFVIPIELDRSRMEQLINVMPLILQKSEQFQQKNATLNVSDQEYNTRFYQSLFEDDTMKALLKQSGFSDATDYEQFYSVMIEMYILLSEQPETIDTAVLTIPTHEREINTLLLKQANEPNNQRLKQTLNRLQYEWTVYKNLVLVNSFMGQLNSFNRQESNG